MRIGAAFAGTPSFPRSSPCIRHELSCWLPLLQRLPCCRCPLPHCTLVSFVPRKPVQVWLDHVNVEITDQVAVKTYHCTFLNPNARAVVGGTCYMELEPGARVSNMSVVVNGKESRAEILDVKKANQVFTEIVKENGSPALLEYYGNQLIQTKIPKIDPRGTVTVKLQYTMLLDKKADLVRLQMLNTNPKAEMQTLKSASVRVAIKSQEPIKNVYSPTHEVKIVEEPEWDVVVKWSEENYQPTHPFVLYYQLAREKVGATLLAHREAAEDGHFMLLLSPTVGGGAGAMTDDDVLPKDVVFCVDTSGSMIKGEKMDQARGALKHCLRQLRTGDRFNIVDFGTGVRQFAREGLVELNDQTRTRALAYASDLYARGGTSLDDALATSLAMFEPGDRLKMIVFATDGLPTIGERSPEKILARMKKENQQDVRLFVFGEGHDVDTKLLDLLASGNRGSSEYVLPDESIQEKIGKFFDRVGSPVMTDVQVFFEGVETRDVLPPSGGRSLQGRTTRDLWSLRWPRAADRAGPWAGRQQLQRVRLSTRLPTTLDRRSQRVCAPVVGGGDGRFPAGGNSQERPGRRRTCERGDLPC